MNVSENGMNFWQKCRFIILVRHVLDIEKLTGGDRNMYVQVHS